MKHCLLLCVFVFAGFWAAPVFAQTDSATHATLVENETTTKLHLGPMTVDLGPPVLFLFGAFCALWAQNTGRNAWLWFFLGLLFSVVTIFFLLTKNANDIQQRKIRQTISGIKPGA
jgi:hypothetical protein